eukprot:CAMPEP_0176104152 /NCGR_PEP_ID=MMETSP0120_2-20121206/52259_1 /TAXON_ID=160619 /ORGANISM="Kryptoperidinium foliaceum, Strain CCMP 1326" /LENGTH=180 /DNA_ID=CAMNT_0017438251 /DNA_START=26 /DNA_END=568 /DNA_ORIENTATION=+
MKLSNLPSFLVVGVSVALILLSDQHVAVEAFAPFHSAATRPALIPASLPPPAEKAASVSATALSVSNQGFDEQDDFPKRKSKEEIEREAFIKDLKDINNKFWDYTVTFFYVAISCLILLNFAGFGYRFTSEGLDVVPIQQYREERQWREEMQRQDIIVPPARPASIMQQAPAAFLMQQQK